MNSYPLYPKLSEEGEKEAQQLIDNFKIRLSKAAEDIISSLYVDIVPHIETDSWCNFRNQILEGFKNYGNRKIQNKWDFKQIRKEIYNEYREDIIPELNQDILEENKNLKEQIEHLSDLLKQKNLY